MNTHPQSIPSSTCCPDFYTRFGSKSFFFKIPFKDWDFLSLGVGNRETGVGWGLNPHSEQALLLPSKLRGSEGLSSVWEGATWQWQFLYPICYQTRRVLRPGVCRIWGVWCPGRLHTTPVSQRSPFPRWDMHPVTSETARRWHRPPAQKAANQLGAKLWFRAFSCFVACVPKSASMLLPARLTHCMCCQIWATHPAVLWMRDLSRWMKPEERKQRSWLIPSSACNGPETSLNLFRLWGPAALARES